MVSSVQSLLPLIEAADGLQVGDAEDGNGNGNGSNEQVDDGWMQSMRCSHG